MFKPTEEMIKAEIINVVEDIHGVRIFLKNGSMHYNSTFNVLFVFFKEHYKNVDLNIDHVQCTMDLIWHLGTREIANKTFVVQPTIGTQIKNEKFAGILKMAINYLRSQNELPEDIEESALLFAGGIITKEVDYTLSEIVKSDVIDVIKFGE